MLSFHTEICIHYIHSCTLLKFFLLICTSLCMFSHRLCQFDNNYCINENVQWIYIEYSEFREYFFLLVSMLLFLLLSFQASFFLTTFFCFAHSVFFTFRSKIRSSEKSSCVDVIQYIYVYDVIRKNLLTLHTFTESVTCSITNIFQSSKHWKIVYLCRMAFFEIAHYFNYPFHNISHNIFSCCPFLISSHVLCSLNTN